MKILVVEDELKVSSFIKHGLTEEGHVVDVANDGEEGDLLISINEYDLILLDVMLPKINGLILCKRVREKGLITPIILLTARDTVQDKVQGLDMGGDDYLTKPFSFAELMARIRAISRRTLNSKGPSFSPKIEICDLVLDMNSRKVYRSGQEITLSNKEFTLLQYLMENSGNVVTRTMISEHVWDIHHDSLTNVVDVYINYLRNKIDLPFNPKLIQTIRGRGYTIKDPSEKN